MMRAILLITIFAATPLLAVTVFAASEDAANAPTTTTQGPPPAKVQAVEETLHGQKIVDKYRWLEDGASPDTKAFVAQEAAYTRSLLDPLPGRDKINARLTQLLALGIINTPQIGDNFYFYSKRHGKQNQPVLYVREGVSGKDRVLVDVNQLAADGTVALDWWYPSFHGKYLAYGTSPSGSEISTLRILETATGKLLSDVIERTRGASVAWLPDNSGFYYTRYPAKGEVPEGQEVYYRHVFFHKLGADPKDDREIFGKGRDPQEFPNVTLSEDGKWLLVDANQGWTKTELFFAPADSNQLKLITTGKNFLYGGEIFKGNLYVLTNEDASRYHIFRASAQKPERANWKEIIPESDAVISAEKIIAGRIFALCEKNASSLLRVYTLDGKLLNEVPLPALGTINTLGGEWDSKEAFFNFQSYTVPPAIYRVPLAGTTQKDFKAELWQKIDSDIDPAKYEVKQEWFSSKDGTKVPMFVVHKKGIPLDGNNPTLLAGYGGFNVSRTPAFEWAHGLIMWLDAGGVYADAALRGGAEFGESWHRAGMLDKKQNVFDDFIAAAEYLIAHKYTNQDRLAIYGRSNGGLLTGAALTQRPDLFRAVVSGVPLLDMLRYQNFQIAKLWIPEYGSADDPQQFKYLYKYSPYHHVQQGAKYPAILFFTADTDTRVDPMHAKKMTALLQAEATNGRSKERPILLRIDTKAGHGLDKPAAKQVEEWTDIWSFLFWQLGVKP